MGSWTEKQEEDEGLDRGADRRESLPLLLNGGIILSQSAIGVKGGAGAAQGPDWPAL